MEIVGIAVVVGITIAVGYGYVRWRPITARSAKHQRGKTYTQDERALLLISLLVGIAGTVLLVFAAVSDR